MTEIFLFILLVTRQEDLERDRFVRITFSHIKVIVNYSYSQYVCVRNNAHNIQLILIGNRINKIICKIVNCRDKPVFHAHIHKCIL